MIIEAGDTVEVTDIRSPFYKYQGKVIERLIDFEQPRYYKIDLGITILRDPSHYERLTLTFNNHQLEVVTKHE